MEKIYITDLLPKIKNSVDSSEEKSLGLVDLACDEPKSNLIKDYIKSAGIKYHSLKSDVKDKSSVFLDILYFGLNDSSKNSLFLNPDYDKIDLRFKEGDLSGIFKVLDGIWNNGTYRGIDFIRSVEDFIKKDYRPVCGKNEYLEKILEAIYELPPGESSRDFYFNKHKIMINMEGQR